MQILKHCIQILKRCMQILTSDETRPLEKDKSENYRQRCQVQELARVRQTVRRVEEQDARLRMSKTSVSISINIGDNNIFAF